MSQRVRNEDVVQNLREKLKVEGYTLNKPKKWGETGVDILATKDQEIFISR